MTPVVGLEMPKQDLVSRLQVHFVRRGQFPHVHLIPREHRAGRGAQVTIESRGADIMRDREPPPPRLPVFDGVFKGSRTKEENGPREGLDPQSQLRDEEIAALAKVSKNDQSLDAVERIVVIVVRPGHSVGVTGESSVQRLEVRKRLADERFLHREGSLEPTEELGVLGEEFVEYLVHRCVRWAHGVQEPLFCSGLFVTSVSQCHARRMSILIKHEG